MMLVNIPKRLTPPSVLKVGGLKSCSRSISNQATYHLEPPQHENVYLGNAFLRRYLQRSVPKPIWEQMEPDLIRFGQRVSGELWQLALQCEEYPPFLRQTDAWGKKTDEIVTSQAWKDQKKVSAEEGLVAIGYERKSGAHSRLHQYVKLMLYGPSSGLYNCPLAMTDGAAKSIECNGIDLPAAFARLTSRDPTQFWTSGQWMTEKKGGSDVGSATETIAKPIPENPGYYSLSGYKWFSSATDSDMALTLARIEDNEGASATGSKGLSMFYLETRNPEDNQLNGITVVKLKNKLGTRQLPTAELLLDGAVARLVSPVGRGIPSISSMLLITRLHNVAGSVSYMRKIIQLARDYATRRVAFGKKLCDHPLHVQTLSRMEIETRGCEALLLDLAHKLGQNDCNIISDQDDLLLRLMMPVAKLYAGKMCIAVVSEGLECFGGQGYIEDTGLPKMLRDCQVLSIWEGTTNILSLDVLRAMSTSHGEALKAFHKQIGSTIATGLTANVEGIKEAAQLLDKCLTSIMKFVVDNRGVLEISARDLSFSFANIYIAHLLLTHAMATENPSDLDTLAGWIHYRNMTPVITYSENRCYSSQIDTYQNFVYDGYDRNNLQ